MTEAALETSTPALVLKLYHGGLGVARTLGRLGVAVHGVHANMRDPGTASRYLAAVHVWDLDEAAPEASVDRLLALGRRIGGRPLLVPTEDVGAMLVADHAEILREVFRFPAQPPGLARMLSSKRGMNELCTRHGVATPATAFPASRADVERFAQESGFPIVVKGIDAAQLQLRTGTRMVIAADADELLREYDRLETPAAPNLMLQEYVPGGPESVWMFDGYFDESSDCVFGITGQKLRQYPPYTGFTSLGICRDNDQVRAATTRFMKQIGYRGVLDLGFRYDARDGTYKLLDVNPRVGTTFRLFVSRDGLDVVRCLYLDLTGQPVYGGDAEPGRKWLVENLDLASSLVYHRRGELSVLEWLRSFRGVQESAWFAGDDPKPFAAMLWSSVAKALPG